MENFNPTVNCGTPEMNWATFLCYWNCNRNWRFWNCPLTGHMVRTWQYMGTFLYEGISRYQNYQQFTSFDFFPVTVISKHFKTFTHFSSKGISVTESWSVRAMKSLIPWNTIISKSNFKMSHVVFFFHISTGWEIQGSIGSVHNLWLEGGGIEGWGSNPYIDSELYFARNSDYPIHLQD